MNSDSQIDTYGYLYEYKFNPFDPYKNLIEKNDYSSCSRGFRLDYDLQKQKTYILVVTNYNPYEIGSFTIIALGPNNVTLKHISEYIHDTLRYVALNQFFPFDR